MRLISGYPSLYLSLDCDDEELHGKAQDVPRVKPMPNCQKDQRGHMGQSLIAKELQAFEDVPKKKRRKSTFRSPPLH